MFSELELLQAIWVTIRVTKGPALENLLAVQPTTVLVRRRPGHCDGQIAAQLVPQECLTIFKNSVSLGAGEGNRTLVCSLGSCRSAIELRPRVAADLSGFGQAGARPPQQRNLLARAT